MPDTCYTILKNKIDTQLRTISKLQEVSDSPKLQFSGYPSAVIIPSEDSSDYETNQENLRIYAFNINLFYEIQNVDIGIGNAVDALYDLADDIMDLFDKDQTLTGISLPTGYTMIAVMPASGAWGEVPDTKLITKTISLKIKISVDIS